MESSKSSSKSKVYSDTGLLQEIREISNQRYQLKHKGTREKSKVQS